MTIKPKPQFRHLTEAAVTAALFDPDPDNPVAIEVNRLIAAHTKAFIAHVQKLGYMPPSLLDIKPRWPIEAVALRCIANTLRESLAASSSSRT